MSVVGPRQVLMEQKEVVPPGYMKRFSVRPGLTGLAQLRGRRSLGWLKQLAFDAEYVEKRNFIYDLGIIFATIKVILLGSGLYGGEGLNWRAYRDSLNGRAPQDSDISRGGVVKGEAVIHALKSKTLKVVALDVFEQQPLPAGSPLWQREDVLITPHVSGTTSHYLERALGVFVANQVFLRGGYEAVTPVSLNGGY